MAETGDLITRVYGNFRGVDFRGEEINLQRSPDALNVWKDYRETERIRTRPAMELYTQFSEVMRDTIYGVFFYGSGDNVVCFIHMGDKLYVNKLNGGARSNDLLWSGVNRQKSYAFVYANTWYFKDGANFLKVDLLKAGYSAERVTASAYVPTTSISRKPAGGGALHEDVNLLTGERINTFVGDGTSKDYFLDSQNIDADYTLKVKVNDKEVTAFTVDQIGRAHV